MRSIFAPRLADQYSVAARNKRKRPLIETSQRCMIREYQRDSEFYLNYLMWLHNETK